MKEVYIIVSPEGGIEYDIFSGKGKVYADLQKAEKALEAQNRWSAVKGYGVYELMTLEVEE